MPQHQQPEISNSGSPAAPAIPASEAAKEPRVQSDRTAKTLADWPGDINIQALFHRYFLQAQHGKLHPATVPISTMEQVLDVGCGGGEWLFDLVKRYPGLTKVVGIDPSSEAIASATVRRNLAGLSQVSLLPADLTSPLPFADESFDFVHMCNKGYTFRATQWPSLLREFRRILKPGGWVTLIEAEFGEISSPAMMRLIHFMAQISSNIGHGLDRTGTLGSPAAYIYGLLLAAGFEDVSYDLSLLDGGFQGGSIVDTLHARLLERTAAFKEVAIQLGLTATDEFDELLLQAEQEIQAPDRCSWAILVSAYGHLEVP